MKVLTEIEHTCVTERIPASFLKGFYLAATNLMQDSGALDQAHEVLTRLCERYPSDGEYAASLATLRCRQGEIKDGRAQFERILARQPEEPNAHRGLAVLDEAAGDPRGALTHYRALIKNNPSDALAAGSIVRCLRALDQPREADEAMRIALRTDPGLAGVVTTPLPAGEQVRLQ